jgi:mono/diheme cytochrome c family protein
MIFLLLFSMAAFAQGFVDLEQGAYLVRAADCEACHSENEDLAFSGGVRLPTPFGDFYTPNITPDTKTGIGLWTFDQFREALRNGISPQGKIYYPSFPYRSFSKITDEDMMKMYLYLRSVPAIERLNRPNRLNTPYDQRWLVMRFWQLLYFRAPHSDPEENLKTGVGPFVPLSKRSPQWNRGAYLVEAVLHCAECHTPRNFLGAPISNRWLAGSDLSISGKYPPNITPDPETGLTWTVQEWTRFLASGLTPQNTTPGMEMALVVRSTSELTKEDRAAVVEYLLSQEPVRRLNAEP